MPAWRRFPALRSCPVQRCGSLQASSRFEENHFVSPLRSTAPSRGQLKCEPFGRDRRQPRLPRSAAFPAARASPAPRSGPRRAATRQCLQTSPRPEHWRPLATTPPSSGSWAALPASSVAARFSSIRPSAGALVAGPRSCRGRRCFGYDRPVGPQNQIRLGSPPLVAVVDAAQDWMRHHPPVPLT